MAAKKRHEPSAERAAPTSAAVSAVKRRRRSWLVVAVVLAAGAFVGWRFLNPRSAMESVAVSVPATLSAEAMAGARSFTANCAQCHGTNAAGTAKGPPLVHDVYNPGHHADAAFVMAARLGVRQHHWPYGDMPPQPQVTEGEIRAIIQYVRELQQANGIVTKAHVM